MNVGALIHTVIATGFCIALSISAQNDIHPDRFSWSADRSADDGKTWMVGFQRIEVQRVGPARSLGALAPAAKPRN